MLLIQQFHCSKFVDVFGLIFVYIR